MQALGGEVPLMRIVATEKPILSDQKIADRVRAAVEAEGARPQGRPLTQVYLSSHLSRVMAGHSQAILCVIRI